LRRADAWVCFTTLMTAAFARPVLGVLGGKPPGRDTWVGMGKASTRCNVKLDQVMRTTLYRDSASFRSLFDRATMLA
jgi:hypothetical protein